MIKTKPTEVTKTTDIAEWSSNILNIHNVSSIPPPFKKGPRTSAECVININFVYKIRSIHVVTICSNTILFFFCLQGWWNHFSPIRKKTNNFRNNKLECHNWLVNDIKRGQLVKNSTKQTAKLVRQALTSHFMASVVIALPKMWVFASAAKSSITRLRKLGQLSRGWGYRGHSKPHKSCSTCTCNCIAWLYSFSKLCSAEDFW